jgi:hypothetical protein
MTCIRCEKTRENPDYALHCPKCLYCGARAIWRVAHWRLPRDESVARRRQTLAEWMAWGHLEIDLRRLSSQADMPLEPLPVNPPERKKR